MRTYVIAGLIAIGVMLPASLSGQVPVVTEGPIRVELSGRVQTQFNTSSADSTFSTFEHRRVRLGAGLTIDDWIEGRVDANFAHGFRLEDAWMNLGFHPAFQIQVGQFKKPFSRIELTSSSTIFPIERGLRIRGLDPISEHHLLLDENGYLGRELGAQIHGDAGVFRYSLGAFNGTGPNLRDENDAKSFAGRLVLKLFEAPFEIGGAASYREFAVVDSLGVEETESGMAVELDMQYGGFRDPGLGILVEVMQAKNFLIDDPMVGAQGILHWFQPLGDGRLEGIEPLVRASYGDASTQFEGNSGLLLTPGLNVYFQGRNRLMLNWDYFKPELDVLDPEHAIRAQLQLYF